MIKLIRVIILIIVFTTGSTIEFYRVLENVKPTVTTRRCVNITDNICDVPELNISLQLKDNIFMLRLKSNKNYDTYFDNTKDPCSYDGIVLEDGKSGHGIFNLIQGIKGMFTFKNLQYFVLPKLFQSNVTGSTIHILEEEHIIEILISEKSIHRKNFKFNQSEYIDSNPEHFDWLVRNSLDTAVQSKRKIKREVQDIKAIKYIELYLVNDVSIYEHYNRNITFINERSKAIAKLLDNRFRNLRTRIILVGIEIWTKKDLIAVTENSKETLLAFMRYRENGISTKNDNAQLITKKTFDNGKTAGKAAIGTICSRSYSAGIDRDSHSNPIYIANVLAHEIGHNLGIRHDNNSVICKCNTHQYGKCIMGHKLDGTVKEFSVCSIKSFENLLKNGHGRCLFDFPKEKKKPVHCGNGIIEKGEQCDCGHKKDCAKLSDQCCDPHTCMFFKNATCSNERCCHKCQSKPIGELCRSKRDECDLPEFCTGLSRHCPNDSYIKDSETCEKGLGYCVSGVCISHDQQCKNVFGNKSSAADSFCYTEFNTKGIKSGHCGITKRGLTACPKVNSFCGKLQCTINGITKIRFMENELRWTKLGITKKCQSQHFEEEEEKQNPMLGLVKDGTRCGNSKICLNQTCIPIADYRTQNMLESCPRNCSNRGVCNNMNNCYCNVGWSPPFCDQPGNGGSINSGPLPSIQKKDNTPLYTVITLIVVVLFIVIFVFCANSFIINKVDINRETNMERDINSSEEAQELLSK